MMGIPDLTGNGDAAWIGTFCQLPPTHRVVRTLARYNDDAREHVSYLPHNHPVHIAIKRERAERRKEAKRMRDLIYRTSN